MPDPLHNHPRPVHPTLGTHRPCAGLVRPPGVPKPPFGMFKSKQMAEPPQSAGKQGHSASAVPVPAVFILPWTCDKSQLASGGLSELRVCNPLQEVGTDPR